MVHVRSGFEVGIGRICVVSLDGQVAFAVQVRAPHNFGAETNAQLSQQVKLARHFVVRILANKRNHRDG